MTEKPELPAAAVAALHQGSKIAAIKIVREAHGVQLKDAKDRVERYLATQPALQRKFADAQAQTQRGCLLFVMVFVIAAIVAYYFVNAP